MAFRHVNFFTFWDLNANLYEENLYIADNVFLLLQPPT